MSIESIKREFNKKVAELEILNRQIAQKQHEKAHIRNQILHHERAIRDIEIRLKREVDREKGLEKKGKRKEKEIQRLKSQVAKHLSELDKIRQSVI